MFVFGLLAQIIVYGSIQFLAPTLALHLFTYEGYDEFWVGVYFSVPAVIYAVNTPMVSLYCKLFSRRGVVWLGMCCFCFSVFLIGTSPLLGIPNLGKVIFMGLCFLGFSTATIVIPIFPAMLDAVEERFPELIGEELNNVAAGYFNSFLGVGEAIGPISASLLTMQFGFRSSEDGIAILILVYCITYFMLCGRTDLLKCISEKEKIEKELNDDNFNKVFDKNTEHAS